MASLLLSTVSKYYRRPQQVGQELEWEEFLIDLPENHSFTLSNNLHTRGFVTAFLTDSLKTGVTLFKDCVCFYGAVLGPILRSFFFFFQWWPPVLQPRVIDCWTVHMFGGKENNSSHEVVLERDANTWRGVSPAAWERLDVSGHFFHYICI